MDGEQGGDPSEQEDEKGFHRGVPNATGRNFDDCWRASVCTAAGRRAGETVDGHGADHASSGRPRGEATFGQGSGYGSSAAGHRPVLN
jgi:hypothetical protein